ncbi:YdeI/OmpD-associated family protein [Alicyclobacillus vulcanalis]|uniref:Uncharacterized conserved protein YdeI, YjbR/CyaY-like superfamily, DUF1801 family n=1 Tax=Alicyclobacillus vulcanalis TaxID=252246 RepID=A0A1N7M2Q6_9BACL|nr:Uncharacterized conserved protein YdeI, YjbR/CyaY-like superfamily, DUF1801 family [Alicyclobacillus vulcanalis]
MRCRFGGTPDCKVHRFQEALRALRGILLDVGLTEELKWRQPCYTHGGRNIVILSAFKEHVALNFLKGGLIQDPHGLLEKPGEHTQTGRQMRFRNAEEVRVREPVIRDYLRQAMDLERAGRAARAPEANAMEMPEELLRWFGEMPDLQQAFEALTPGRRRAYLIYFSAPKQSKTRMARVETCIPLILQGKGLYDR